MARCVSDRVLLRLYVGEGTAGQRAHVRDCVACADRAEQLRRDVGPITRTLVTMPAARSIRGSWARWALPAWGLAGVAVAATAWVSMTLWPPETPEMPVPPAWRVMELASLLEEVSTVMFSVSGDPSALAESDPPGQSGMGEALDRSCEATDWLEGTCAGLPETPGATR